MSARLPVGALAAPPAAAALSAALPAPAPAGTGAGTGRRAAARLAWALWAIGVALCVLGPLAWALSGFAHVDGNVLYRAGLPLGVVYGVVFVAVATQGALIAARWPHNPIGWMGCAAAILVGLLVFGGGFYAYAWTAGAGSLRSLVGPVLWAGLWCGDASSAVVGPVLLLFPD